MTFRNFLMLFAFLFSTSFLLTSCDNNDDNNDDLVGDSITYELSSKNNSGISGEITFEELTDGRIQAIIDLENTTTGTSLPAHVHANSALIGGDIIIPLDDVDGATGSSVTIFNMLNDGSLIDFDRFKNLDAYVNIHESADALNVIVAQADIGSNAFSGEEQVYNLNEMDVDGISGSIIMRERLNGFTYARIELDNTPDSGMHPAHIHNNSAAESGAIAISLGMVDGSTGVLETDIRSLDNGNSITYNQLLGFNGYVNVHLSADQLTTIVAQGDIGSNELTGESIEYNLEERSIPGISGTLLLEERKDGSALATIELVNTPDDGFHPASIRENSMSAGGDVAITLNPVDGETGLSITSIRSNDEDEKINYNELLIYDGYATVSLSLSEINVVVAEGNIGINAK